MKKKLFTFFCAMAALFVSQSAWASQGDKTTYYADWSGKALDAIAADGSFQSKSDNGLVFATIAGDRFIKYKEDGDFMSVPHFDMGTVKEGGFYYNLAWQAAEFGYTMTVSEAYTRVRSYGVNGAAQCFWGKLASGTNIGSTISDKTFEISTSKFEEDGQSMPFRFYRDGVSATFCMKEFRLSVDITPDAPAWTQATTDMLVTVNSAAQHFVDLPALLQLPNVAFAGSVKYELTSGNDQYVIWNEEHTMFCVLKPDTYTVRAYIDMVEGAYSSSEYSEELTITATSDAAEQATAQVFFYVDGKLIEADEAGLLVKNLGWTENNRHGIEYVYGYDGELTFTKKTEYGLNYMASEGRVDSIRVNQVTSQDTILVNGSMLLINTFKTTNHVTFTIADEATMDALLTRKENVSWDEEYEEITFDYQIGMGSRVFEVSFLGVPDSLFFQYGNNSDLSQNYATMMVEYATTDGDTWTEIETIEGKPRQSYKSFQYALLPNVNRLRFTYANVQNSGWIKNLKVTERKQIVLNEQDGDTILLSGRHSADGVATLMDNLKWYNVGAPIQWEITGDNAAKFTMTADGLNPQLDTYSEQNEVTFTYQLNEVGVHFANLTIFGKDLDPKTGMPKAIYHAVLKGVTGYNPDELILEKTIESPVDMLWQDSIANPFVVKDKEGNILTDSVELKYEIAPEGTVTVANGMIYATCVGENMVVAKLQENLMMSALTDTLYLHVSEKTGNEINWDIPAEIAVGSVLENLATTADSAEMSYSFIPKSMATDLGGNRIQVGMQTGKVEVMAHAAQTCEHEAMDSLKVLTIKRPIKDSELVIKNQEVLGEVRVEDTIANMVQVFDSISGIELTPEAAKVEYSVVYSSVEGAATIEDGNLIVMHHKSRVVVIKAVISGDTLLTRTEYIRLEVLSTNEKVNYVNLPDTMLIGTQYDMNALTWVRSGLNIDSVFTDAEMADYMLVDAATWKITPAAVGEVMLYARSNGNVDYVGPDTAKQMVSFVLPILPIDWSGLGDLNNKHVDEVIDLSNVKVFTQNIEGLVYNVTEQVNIAYDIFPATAAHIDERGDLVLDEAGDITIYVTVSGLGYQTIQDTLTIHSIGYQVGNVEITQSLEGLHVGDLIPLSAIKVYDIDGNSMDQYITFDYSFLPADAAHVEGTNIVIDKVDTIALQINMSGVKIEPYSYSVNMLVVPFEVGEIIFPDEPEGGYRTDDVIYTSEFIVKDVNGQDITKYVELTYVFNPTTGGAAKDGNLVLTATGNVELVVKVGGGNVIATQSSETYFVRHNEANCHDLLVQYWSDVLVVNNNEEEHIKRGLPQFVSYQWYREEELLAGETNQDYHISAGEISGAYAYYAIATGKDGKQYLLCEKFIDERFAPDASTSFKVYPTMVSAGSSYTVEVESAGKLYVTTNTGVAMGTYDVVKGKNTFTAPATIGVYVLQFAPESGAFEVQKLIVR